MYSPLRPQPTPGDHDFNKLESTRECFHTSFSFSSQMDFEKIAKDFFLKYFSVKNNLTIVTHFNILLSGIIIWANINLLYLRMFSIKFQLFWPNGW